MNLENVKECGDAVCQRSTDPKVSNNMMQLSVKYQGLVSQAKVGFLHFLLFVKTETNISPIGQLFCYIQVNLLVKC